MTQNAAAYNVDVALCIDGTGSMHGIIDTVKTQAKSVFDMYSTAMESKGRVGGFRIRVIVFRDYQCDGNDAMVESDFFDLSDPDQQLAFENFVDGIEAMGGGDGPENALEAITLALRSKWTTSGGRFRRHAILLFTDAPALPLLDPERKDAVNYPEGMPANVGELHELFDHGDQEMAPYYSPRHGRLVVFAPESAGDTWSAIKTWDRAWVVPTKPGGGCEEIELENAIAVLVGSF